MNEVCVWSKSETKYRNMTVEGGAAKGPREGERDCGNRMIEGNNVGVLRSNRRAKRGACRRRASRARQTRGVGARSAHSLEVLTKAYKEE